MEVFLAPTALLLAVAYLALRKDRPKQEPLSPEEAENIWHSIK